MDTNLEILERSQANFSSVWGSLPSTDSSATQSRTPSDADDYSSDSSECSAAAAPQPAEATPGRPRLPAVIRSTSNQPDVRRPHREAVFPLVYKFAQTTTDEQQYIDSGSVTGVGKVGLKGLSGLVKYSTSDLLSRAWHLCPTSLKKSSYPLFSKLSKCPELLETRYASLDEISSFMCSTALQLGERRQQVTSLYLRSLLVQAVVQEELSSSIESSAVEKAYHDSTLNPLWEQSIEADQQSGDTQDEIDSDDSDDHVADSVVTSLDFCVALSFPSSAERLPLESVTLLHQIVTRCLKTTAGIPALHSWGVKYITKVLSQQLYRNSSGSCPSQWLSMTALLIYKIVIASSNTKGFLSILRWTLLNSDTAKRLEVSNSLDIVKMVEHRSSFRLRLTIPMLATRNHIISLLQSLGPGNGTIKGLCVFEEDGAPRCIVFTQTHTFKISFTPPFDVLNHISSAPACCKGVSMEEDQSISVIGNDGTVYRVDKDTLQVVAVLHPPSSLTSSDFVLYTGENTFVAPYSLPGTVAGQQLLFDGDLVNGTLFPSTSVVPLTCDSLSIQFYLQPIASGMPSEMCMVHITSTGKVWLSVSVVLNPVESTLTLIFKQGPDTVAEVREPLKQEWALWSATLTSSSDLASWAVYKNGVLCTVRSSSAPVVRPMGTITSELFKGRLYGYLSSLQIWCNEQSIEDMCASARDGATGSRQLGLVFSFPMNEGLGLSLYSAQTGGVWRGLGVHWSTPPKPLPAKSTKSQRIPWRPMGDYYTLTNHSEFVVVEERFTTWIDKEGCVLEQREEVLRPSDRPFYSVTNGNLYLTTDDSLNIRAIFSSSLPSERVRMLPSVSTGRVFCEETVETVTKRQRITLLHFAEYLMYRLNMQLLTSANKEVFFVENMTRTKESLVVLGRLLDLISDLVTRLESGERRGLNLELFLCTIGRLLAKYAVLFECCCPGKVVHCAVEVHQKLQRLTSAPDASTALKEVAQVFNELHQTVIARCVSHDYRLKLINESANLKDVRQLLVPEALPQLVLSAIQKDMKKLFMTFLHRLKEECQLEASHILSRKTVEFAASEAMRTTLLGMLSQKEHVQWHLVAVALLGSLCKWILRRFEEEFPTDEERASNNDVLKETSIGVVLFPVAHYMYGMSLHPSIASDSLKALNDARKCLAAYNSGPRQETTETVFFSESHLVSSPPLIVTPFSAQLFLQHAEQIVVKRNDAEEEMSSAPPISVSFITNTGTMRNNVLDPGLPVTLREGAQVLITCGSNATSDNILPGVSLSVHAKTTLVVKKMEWIRSICLALSHIIIHVTHQDLQNSSPSNYKVARNSFLRGGISSTLLQPSKIPTLPGEVPDTNENIRVRLFRLASDEEESLSHLWKTIYDAKQVQYAKRLENVLRWSCCALVWHTLTVGDEKRSLEELLATSIDALKRKTFLFLEASQQRRESDIVDRARLLLCDITPRLCGEAQLIENQHTEEPVFSEVGERSRALSRPSFLFRRSSRGQAANFQAPPPQTIDFSNYSRGSQLNSYRTMTKGPTAAHIFSKAVKDTEEESLSTKVIYFLINGIGKSMVELMQDLVLKTKDAAGQVAAYRLQEELCKAFAHDREMLALILTTHLKYRLSLSKLPATTVGDESDENPERVGFSRHYTDQLIGCGFSRELELQKAFCSFIQTMMHILLHKMQDKQDVPLMECMYMCATLCHPWNGVDMSLLRPNELFFFLKKLLSIAFSRRVATGGSNAEAYYNSRGLFELSHRCTLTPNAILHTSVEGVRIVESDVQGLNVENVNVVFSARTHWKVHGGSAKLPTKSEDADLFANYGIPGVFSEVPDVQYFEITLDFALHPESPELSIGLSSVPISPQEVSPHDRSICLNSSGNVMVFMKKRRSDFTTPWKVGDVIGCGLLAPTNSVFFTHNGKFLGAVIELNSPSTVVPYVEVCAGDTLMKVIVNFGEEQPFKFDLAQVHCSCRHHYLTPAVVCDAVVITVNFLISLCYRDLSSENEPSASSREAMSNLLEQATSFLAAFIMTLVLMLNETGAGEKDRLEYIVVLISRLLHCTSVIIECFRFDCVTAKTHLKVLQLCATIIVRCRDKWVKVRAAQCIALMCSVLRPDYLVEASESLRSTVSPEEIVQQLVDLSRLKLVKEIEPQMPPPKWVGNTTVVKGKGAFLGSAPMPKTGKHMVGFRLKRRQQQAQGVGAPLGGCYYVGLAHGQVSIHNMSNLLGRSDVYVLQDTDDQDQVAHLLLRRNCIPRNNHRRVFGNDEVVWVELNADYGEITFYRENMILIGLAFANLPRVDDLYPILYSFNEDASCELIPATPPTEPSIELWSENVRRSTAINTLQELHLIPCFSGIISQMAHRAISQLDRGLDACLVALGVLGGERSYRHCQHDTYGLVVVHAIAEVTEKAVVFLASDGDHRLFCIPTLGLRPSFIQTPLYSRSAPDAHSCASLLCGELYKILYEASAVAPVLREEEEMRKRIVEEHDESLRETSAVNLIGLLTEQERCREKAVAPSPSLKPNSPLGMLLSSSSSTMITSRPVVVDLHCSSKTLYVPNPSTAVTTSAECSVIRGNAILDSKFTLAISVAEAASKGLMYIGVTSSSQTWPETQDDVVHWDDTWALCNYDSAGTNNINCCVEPGIIFGAADRLYDGGDILIIKVDREEGTVAFTRDRNREIVEFGVLFDDVPATAVLRPVVVCGPETVAVFSVLNQCVFPARMTYPKSTFHHPTRGSRSCYICSAAFRKPGYGSEDDVCLCSYCFHTWKRPTSLFFLITDSPSSVPNCLISNHCPEQLIEGSYVEFEENLTLIWSLPRSVNAEVQGSTCLAVKDECFAFSEALSQYGTCRVDVKLSHIAGVAGHPFSGFHAFTPLWRNGQHAHTVCTLRGDCIAVSTTLLPIGTKSLISLHIDGMNRNVVFSTSEVFVGVTTLTDTSCLMSRTGVEQLCASKSAWGAWCDTSEKINSQGDVYILVDSLNNCILLSSSLGGLQSSPFVVACNISPGTEVDSLRLIVFSHDPCMLVSKEGLVTYNERVEPSFTPLAIGLFPETVTMPSVDTFSDSIVLMDTVERTQQYTKANWVYAKWIDAAGLDTLFYIGDTVTLVRNASQVTVYTQGVQVATVELTPAQCTAQLRVVVYLSTRGTMASLVPPLYGKTHIGKIMKVYGSDVGVVETTRETGEAERFIVRRKDTRFCALSASSPGVSPLQDGDAVAFRVGGLQMSKRGSVASIQGTLVKLCENNDKRTLLSVDLDQCFSMRNEGKDYCSHELYPLISPPTSFITKVFEVGKRKFQPQSRSSYNGIVFDCKVAETIEIVGLSVLTRTSGTHQVKAFYRKGTSDSHVNDPSDWSVIFSGSLEMKMNDEFNIPFLPIIVEAGSTFAFYVNTSHNCGVGFYSEEDGCTGAVGQELDSDGTLSVRFGRKSGSCDPFTDLSPSARGFCGTIKYKQSCGSMLPVIESKSTSRVATDAALRHCSDSFELICRPPLTRMETAVNFRVKVISLGVRFISFTFPISFVPSSVAECGVSHFSISMFYAGDEEREWKWIWNSRSLVESEVAEVALTPMNLCLDRGSYRFAIILSSIEGEHADSSPNFFLMRSSDEAYVRRNDLISVEGYFGDIHCEANTPVQEGELHTMSTGASLNQSNSASYNGIMFDIRSKEDVTLEEVFCISQTTTERVTVRLFWKEGSMEGAEKSAHEWREVSTKELALVDKQPFSVGPLMLRMRANQCYAMFINTSSSCGVRFYNSSDGHLGDIRDEFDTDGVLTIYVGRKSESATPFAELPMEPRGFRGRILYRTYTLKAAKSVECAIFPYMRGFLVTRILVALMSYVELSDYSRGCNFSYEKLLKTVSLLGTSSLRSVADLDSAESMLASMIRYSASAQQSVVSIPLSSSSHSFLSVLSTGDLALLPGIQGSLCGSLVTLTSNVQVDGVVTVSNTEESKAFRVAAKRLLPIAKCTLCGEPYATGSCTATGRDHLPPPNEDARACDIIANALYGAGLAQRFPEAHQIATSYITQSQNGNRSAPSSDEQSSLPPSIQSTPTSTGVRYTIPVSVLSSEDEYSETSGLLCPLIFHPAMSAAVTLHISATNDNFSIYFVTDAAARCAASEKTEAATKLFFLSLYGSAPDGHNEQLTKYNLPFFAACDGAVCVPLVTNLHAGYVARLQTNGVVVLDLRIEPQSLLPPPTPLAKLEESCWLWENNSVQATLTSTNATYLQNNFSPISWPAGLPRFSSFTVAAKSMEPTIFLEMHVARVSRRTPSGMGGTTTSATRVRKPFALQSGEVVTLRLSAEGDFFVYDVNDVIRCHVSKEELHDTKNPRHLLCVGFQCVGPEKVKAFLYVPQAARQKPRLFFSRDAKATAAAVAAAAVPSSPTAKNVYHPFWVVYNVARVKVSEDSLTASSSSQLGGEVVLGTPLPDTGISSFVLFMRRKDCRHGSPLGSGHFAGVAVSNFSDLAPYFSDLKHYVNSLWVIQDVQDEDSMPNQASLPPLTKDESGTDSLFCDGTKLLFIVDRSAGTLSLSRNNESPRVVFQGIPTDVQIAPFVRLDHTSSFATLARFPGVVDYGCTHQPSLEMALASQPITPSLVRRYPLFMSMRLFPFFNNLVHKLPTDLAGVLEHSWCDTVVHTRFQYRVSNVLEQLTAMGVFSLHEYPVDEAAVDKMVLYLKQAARPEVAAFPMPSSTEGGAARKAGGCDDCIYLHLPAHYELIGRVRNTNMIRLLYIDPSGHVHERTLHLFFTDDPKCNLNNTNAILPHTSVMTQHEVLSSLNCPTACGIVTDGWFDCTLRIADFKSNVKAQNVIASSLVYALEHWHLHFQTHGHICSDNIYLRLIRHDVIQCCLWNVHCSPTTDPLHSKSLQSNSRSDFCSDLTSCMLLLVEFDELLKSDQRIADFVRLMMQYTLSISEALQTTEPFQDMSSDNGEGPSCTLRTGSRLRGGSGSYNGIMFDVVAKNNTVRITKLSFTPDCNVTSTVRLFTRSGTFLGSETDAEAWTQIMELELAFIDNTEISLDITKPITITAGSRAAIFLHTTSGSGVLFFSESEGLQGNTGDVEEENDDIGITVGKKSESSQPFNSVQNQKRLLKGSITYTVLMRSNGPRSRLIYSSDLSIPLSRWGEEPLLSPVVMRTAESLEASGLLIPTLLPEDLHPSDMDFQTVPYALPVEDTVVTDSSDGNRQQLFLRGNRFEWCDVDQFVPGPSGMKGEATQHLLEYAADLRRRRSQLLLSNGHLGVGSFPCRPLRFMRIPFGTPSDGTSSNNGGSYIHPTVLPDYVFVSEPIRATCLVSLWKQANDETLLWVTNRLPTSGDAATLLSASQVLLGGKRNGIFVRIDSDLRSVVSHSKEIHLRLKEELAESPVYLVAQCHNADNQNTHLFCYTNDCTPIAVVPGTSNCFAITSPPTHNTSSCLVAVGAADSPSHSAAEISVSSLIESTMSVRLIKAPNCEEESEREHRAFLRGATTLQSFGIVREIGPWIVECNEQRKWKTVVNSVSFTCLSSSLALRGPRGVNQVTGGMRCPGFISYPRFTATERHQVLLRLQFPRRSPIILKLSNKNVSAPPYSIPYGYFDTLVDRLLLPPAREVYLYLDVNIPARQLLIMSSDGAVCHSAVEENSASYELQLYFWFSAPGSQLDVINWRVTPAQSCGDIDSTVFQHFMNSASVPQLSANTALTVGTISRHSARGVSALSRDNNLSSVKQMEVLMVTYARLLLEKTLVSQEAARAAVQSRLLYLLSFTSLRSSPAVLQILESDLKQGSFHLISQSIAHLSAPFLLQSRCEVEAGINVISSLTGNDLFRRSIRNVFGSTLPLLLLRIATTYTRTTRHIALRCVQEFLADERIPLPHHAILSAHLKPILDMVCSLCKRDSMASAVVQIGVTLISNLISRYQRERPSLTQTWDLKDIPFMIVLCCREVIHAITCDPPLPLPSVMVAEKRSTHKLSCCIDTTPSSTDNNWPSVAHFTEEGRDSEGIMCFTVVLNANRRGRVLVGWNLVSPINDCVPSFGYWIDGRSGSIFTCDNHFKSDKNLLFRVNAGDELEVSANYKERTIRLNLKRAGSVLGETRFDVESGEIGLPFFSTEHNTDATFYIESLRPGPQVLNIEMLYHQIQQASYELDTLPAQSYEFYAELNLFAQGVLKISRGRDLVSRTIAETSVATHELAGYTQVSSVLSASAFADAVQIEPLQPYLLRLQRLDELTAAFAPLINLRRRTELFGIFRILKNLCSRETEEEIQSRIMEPFQHRQGKKIQVTIHTMQAQPTTTTGPFPTLMRSVFGQLYLQLHQVSVDTYFMSPIFSVKLAGFGSTDAGGPYRDVLSQLGTEIMTPHPNRQMQLNPLFVNCGRGGVTAIMPNVPLLSSAQVPLMLEFFGKLLASFFLTSDLLPVEFPPLFWKLLLNEDASIKDLAHLDADIAKLIQPEELMMRTQDELQERFPGIIDTWATIVSENQQFLLDDTLPPDSIDGARLLSQKIVANEIDSFSEVMSYLQRGFDQVLPLYTLQAYRWQKVELLICGTQKLSCQALLGECDIQLTPGEATMFRWVLDTMTDEDRTLLLRFTTGQSRLPLKTKIKVLHNGNKNSLPTSSTCFFTLRLPSYSSAEKMKERILYAVRQCKAIDADGPAREHLFID